MRTRSPLLVCLAAALAGSGGASGDTLIGSFEGPLTATPINTATWTNFTWTSSAGPLGGNWDTDIDLVDDGTTPRGGPNPEHAVVDAQILVDDPLTTASEGVTQGTQSLQVEFYQWQNGYKPYLSLAAKDPLFTDSEARSVQLADMLLQNDALSLDMTPIPPDNGAAADWIPNTSWRQAFFALDYKIDGVQQVFGKVQRDWDQTAINANDEPQPDELSWNFSQFVGNDNVDLALPSLPAVATWKDWAQIVKDEAVNPSTLVEFNLWLIFQGRDVDENGAIIPFNPFNPTGVKAAIDNIQLIGDQALGITGDYNEDGVVDAADYVEWREALGGQPLPNRDSTLTGPTSQDDYDVWVANYGRSASSTSGSLAVPEPSAAALVLVAWSLASRRAGRAG